MDGAENNLAMQLVNVSKSIKTAFDYEVSQDYGNKEDVLCLGVKYGYLDDEYFSYENATRIVERCKNSISGNVTSIRSAFSSLSMRYPQALLPFSFPFLLQGTRRSRHWSPR